MASPNLGIIHIAAAQNQKEVTANAGFDQLDNASNGVITEAMSDAGYNVPLTDAQNNQVFIFTGTLTKPRGVTLPSIKRLYVVSNQTIAQGSPIGTAYPLTFGTSSSPTGRLAVVEGMDWPTNPFEYVILYCDGINVDRVTPDLAFRQALFTVVGTTEFEIPAPNLKITLVGAGGGGGGCSNSGAAGGGGGAAVIVWLTGLTPGQTIQVTVGGGGAGGVGAQNGQPGGPSSIFSASQIIATVVAGGGGGGNTGNSNGGAPGVASTGGNTAVVIGGGGGGYGFTVGGTNPGGYGGSGGALGSTGPEQSGAGGGANGNAPGDGGGGASHSAVANGGRGSNGIVIIEWAS